jgi:ketosteroid isomerase-like protein
MARTRWEQRCTIQFVIWVCVVIACVTASVGPTGAQESNPMLVVKARNAIIMAAAANKDAAAMASVYTVDAAARQNAETIQGREAIQKAFEAQFEQGLAGFDLETSLVDLYDGKIREVGTYRMTTAVGRVMSQGTYLNTWTKDGGVWRIERVVVAEQKTDKG